MQKESERESAKKLAAAIGELIASRDRPVVLAVDGGSGAGKSSLAKWIGTNWNAALIPLDDFYDADIPDLQWDEWSIEEKLESVFDWDRLRREAVEPLIRGERAGWRAFDFESGPRPDGTYALEAELETREPAELIVIEGAYSSGPALSDLIDLAILVDVPVDERHVRLAAREDPNFLRRWHRRWDEVEEYYFTHVRPIEDFDLVVRAADYPFLSDGPHQPPGL